MATTCYIPNPTQVYTDKLVYALTNYADGYADQFFPDTRLFSPEAQSKQWERVHAALGLNIRSHNQLIFMALQSLHARPRMLELIGQHVPSYDLRLLPKEYSTLDDARFNTGPTHGNILEPAVFPIQERYEIRYLNEGFVRATFGAKTKDLRYTPLSLPDPSSSLNLTRLDIKWDTLPVEGPVSVSGPWVAGRTFDIYYVPPRVDPNKWVTYLNRVVDPVDFLAPVGLYEEYSNALSSSEKLAVFYVALALQNTSMESWPQP